MPARRLARCLRSIRELHLEFDVTSRRPPAKPASAPPCATAASSNQGVDCGPEVGAAVLAVAAAAVAVVLRAPFLAVVAAAAITTALIRLL